MTRNHFFPPSILLPLLLSCTSDTPTRSAPSLPAEGGARLLPLSGTVLRLGSSDPQAAPEEAPGWTRFLHDVWMDTNLVSQAEFKSLLARNPSTIAGETLPVTNATWFDAALCANARSKRDHLDTVYDYVAVSQDPAGNAIDLPGLSIHFDRTGWRLPTEAEWEAAARAGTTSPYPWGTLADSTRAPLYAWFSRNSGGTLHPVGGLAPNAWGLRDMAGNAMEWVSDWKGSFPHDTLADYAGLDAPGDIPEVALKGGAYGYGIFWLRPSARSATYPAYRSSRAEYVGFRLARGAFAATYGNASGQIVDAPPVTIVPRNFASSLGVRSAKLAFINRSGGKGILSWIDFSEASPVARTLLDRDPVFHPAISPDGNWVAWCTAPEGSTSPSHVKIRRLARNDTTVLDLGEGAIPRWWTDGADTFLIRAEALDNTSSGWGATATLAQKWSGAAPTGASRTWAPNGSYHDGRTGPYLYTGYKRLKQYDTRTGASRVLFTAPRNGKAAGDTSQVCNVSAAPDSSGRSLFLDFGYSGRSSVVGRPYGIHEIAFVSDSAGTVVGQIPSPSGESQWDHLEWSNSPRWAVSSALDATNAAHAVYLLDLQTGATTKILAGTDLWQPALWTGRPKVVLDSGGTDPDSTAAWNSPATDVIREEFAIKNRGFWLVRDRIEIAAIGSSRVKSGISPATFTTGKAYNWGWSGSEPIADRRILEDYVLPQCPRLKVVILSLMPGWMFQYRGENGWKSLQTSIGYTYDRNHDFWKNGLPQEFLALDSSRRWSTSSFFDSLGTGTYASGGWGSGAPVQVPPPAEDFQSTVFQDNWNDLMAIADLCRSRSIDLILVNFPQSPGYANTNLMGKYGPTWATWHVLQSRLRAVESTNPWFHFYDAHADAHHDYPDSAAVNWDHLSSAGSRMISRRLDSLIAFYRSGGG